MTTRKLWLALACYAALAAAAWPIRQTDFRLAVWVLFAGLGLKTYLAWLRHKTEQSALAKPAENSADDQSDH